MKTTHNGDIKTDETDYVSYKCDVYNLPDNTNGEIGYHVVYRPLCRPHYAGSEVVTDKMYADTVEHYKLIEDAKKEKEIIKRHQPKFSAGQIAKAKAWDYLFNEGGDGFNPYRD